MTTKPCLFRATAVSLFLTAGLTLHASTLYVDQRYGPGGNGSTNAPYNTIQVAIGRANSEDVIIVYPGTYMENLAIVKNIRIIGYDGPHTTAIDGSAGSNVVSVARGLTVWLMGLKISSGVNGVYQPTQGTLYLRNCIFCGNRSHGVYAECTDLSLSPTLYMDNCISVANGGSGLHIHGECTGYIGNRIPTVRAQNNILIGNTGFGLELYVKGYNSGYGFSLGEIILDYNDYGPNGSGNYSSLFGPAGRISVGAHSFSGPPDFVGGSAYTCNQDYRLSPTSMCRNAGAPGVGWLNPDGTVNDVGAYGGPGAATFFTNPNDGPIIRNVTIDQGMVPKGSTFTIRATGAVR